MRRNLKLTAVLVLAGSAVASQAVIVMDQVGTQANVTESVNVSMRFDTANVGYSSAAIDDFSVTSGQVRLTQIEAVVLGFNGTSAFSSFQNVQSWNVEIYNSVGAAVGNLTGNVASQTFLPGAVTLNTSYYTGTPPIANVALLTIPVNILLPSAGTYWIGVVGRLDSTSGQVGVGSTSFAAGFPNNNNGTIVNPGGSFLLEDNQLNTGENFGYRINAVPEPATMAALAIGAAGLLARRRRKA
jgi:hypothetical protein